MGSWSSYVFCPRCGNPAHVESHTRLPEEHLNCLFCGYWAGTRIDHEKLIDGQPVPEPEEYEYKAAGAVYFEAKRNVGNRLSQWGHIRPDDNGFVDWEAWIAWFKKILKEPWVDASESYLTKWDEENKRLVNLVGVAKRRIPNDCPLECPEKCWEKYPEEGPEKCPRESVGTPLEETGA